MAVTAGVDATDGDAVVLIDADLQDPPHLIRDLIAAWEKGFDVVYGVRSERAGESRFKKKTAALFYRLLNRVSEVPIPLDTGDFRLMDRAVVDVLKTMPERHRFLRGMVSWIGFDQTGLAYNREARLAGTTKYPLRKMIRFASDGWCPSQRRPSGLRRTSGSRVPRSRSLASSTRSCCESSRPCGCRAGRSSSSP